MNTRRRGLELEEAILHAAWEELMHAGYKSFTMEEVASRAKTSKPVIYRRWANREELVLATIQKNMPKPVGDIPDTGDIRNDVIIVMKRLNDTLSKIGAETLHGLMSVLIDIPFSEILNMRRTNTMQTIIQQAIERGEIKEEKVSERIARLPIDLIRHELLNTYEPVADKTIVEIVDNIFLPLIK